MDLQDLASNAIGLSLGLNSYYLLKEALTP